MNVLLLVVGIAVAGAVGSVVRHEVLRWAGGPATVDRARAIALVNLVGALLLGAVALAPLADGLAVVLGLGFCGSLTTFSTWVLEAVVAREAGRDVRAIAALDLVGQLVVGIGLVLLLLA